MERYAMNSGASHSPTTPTLASLPSSLTPSPAPTPAQGKVSNSSTTPPSSTSKTSTSRGANGVLLIPHAQLQYTDTSELALGAQGNVYKVQWKSRDVIFTEFFLGANEVPAFFNKLEVWWHIHHPNSVALYGALNDSGKVGYITEYCPNGNLHDQIKDGMVFGPKTTIDLMCGIADILCFLHDSGVAHGDVKSANIMLDNDFRPKLGDFRLSQMLSTTHSSANNTLKADVFSFGMVMYELTTHKVPFDGKKPLEISCLVAQGELPVVQVDLPTGMEDDERALWWKIVKQCWAQDPLVRPSMEEVSKMLVDLKNQILGRIEGFCCNEHKFDKHDFFLSYRVATESSTVSQLFDLLAQTKRKSGESIKVFLDAKCLTDTEEWHKRFLYGLHHAKIIVPVVSPDSLKRCHNAHEENDNLLLEFEHMLSLLTLSNGKVKVFPIFIDAFPRAADYPDKPHITTGKSIRKTIAGLSQLQGKKITLTELGSIIPALLAKLAELDTGANVSSRSDFSVTRQASFVKIEVSIRVEGELPRDKCISVSSSANLMFLRTLIVAKLDDFDFEFKFLNQKGPRTAVISTKQETTKTVGDIMDTNNTVTVRKV